MPSLALQGGVGFCNAVRRALLSDVRGWAPFEVEVRTNTSCQTDEYLAHRIGLIPFRRVADGVDEMTLRVCGPCTATARDLTGPGFEAVHGGIEIIVLGQGQEVDMTVRFDERQASVHARYTKCAAVGMHASGDHHVLNWEVIDGSSPKQALLSALDALDARVDHALRELAHQPSEAPQSMC